MLFWLTNTSSLAFEIALLYGDLDVPLLSGDAKFLYKFTTDAPQIGLFLISAVFIDLLGEVPAVFTLF